MPTKKKTTIDISAETSALNTLFVDELKDILWAEKHLIKALPKMAKAATSEELKSAFTNHLEQTKNQVARLEQVFASIGEKASAVKCDAMEGLVKEAEGCIEDTEDGTLTRDAGLISCGQKVEHYEIASYGTLKTFAAVLGYAEAASLLEETLNEEKTADQLLTTVAESFVNEQAKAEKE